MEVITKSSEETKELGKKIGDNLVSRGRWIVNSEKTEHGTPSTEHQNILALSGNLGSGKTTFIQGLAKGLRIRQRIISPTFIIMRKYRIKLITNNSKRKTKIKQSLSLRDKNPLTSIFYHIDLYRLEDDVEKEVKNLGIEDIWGDPENIVAIEWAEKIKDLIPKAAIWIKFEDLGGDKRKISVNYVT